MALLDLFSYACGVDSVGMIPPRWSTRGVRPRSALAKTAVLCTASFSFAHTVPRFMRRGMGRGSRRWSTRGVRPLWALAKAAVLRTVSFSFAHTVLRFMRRGMGRGSRRWSTRGVRPRSALAKAAVLRADSFSFVLTLLRLRRRQCAQMKNSPLRGCFCSLVPVVGLEPTRILLHRILSPARLPVSPHRRR